MTTTQTVSKQKLEMMRYRLAKLLYDYSINRKTVDEDYIRRVIDAVINGRELVQYVRNYEITREPQIVFVGGEEGYQTAFYDPNNKSITLSLDGIKMDIEQSKDDFMYLFPSELEQYLYINFIVTQVILHELEHANQSRLMDTVDNMESRLLLASGTPRLEIIQKIADEYKISTEEVLKIESVAEYVKLQIQEFEKKYYEFYKYAPKERLAEIRSHQQLIDALNILEGQAERLTDFAYAGKLENMLRGYDDYIISPSTHFLKNVGNGEDLRIFDWYDPDEARAIIRAKQNYSLEDRLTYGLPSTFDERERVEYALQKTIKYS